LAEVFGAERLYSKIRNSSYYDTYNIGLETTILVNNTANINRA